MANLLDGLNDAQKEAVQHGQGPMLVLAGPGSGKTRVITHRVAYLIEHYGVPDRRILAVTFTNKAAGEMKERIAQLVGDRKPLACTFHSLCARILRQFAEKVGRTQRFTILDQRDRSRQLAALIRDLGLETTHFTPESVEKLIGQLKNDLISPAEFKPKATGVFESTVASVYEAYSERLVASNAVDFDDLLYLVADLLRKDEAVRSELDRRYEYVLVDEYQDTNLAQYAIARALSVEKPNLCVTGDPDQSIYSWRGANIRNILDFESDFPGAKVVRLERNYRSRGHILAVADGLIRHNHSRKSKDLWTDNPPGEPVVVRCYRDDRDEANSIAEQIRRTVDDNDRRYRDFAIFVRTSSLTRPIEAAFRDRRIPYRVVGGFSFFERKEVKDIVAYLRLATNPRDDSAFERAMNVPARGIGDTSFERLRQYALEKKVSLPEAALRATSISTLRGKAKTSLKEFGELILDLGRASELPLGQAVKQIIEISGYLKQFDENDIADRDRIDNVNGLVAGALELEQSEPEADLVRFLETVSLSSDLDGFDESSDIASIMTLHSAKGLEFPVVFMVAMENKILPHDRAMKNNDIEEERRLAFVGITRAMEWLQISYCVRRSSFGYQGMATPSSFLSEMPEDSLRREDVVAYQSAISGFSPYRPGEESQENGYEEPAIQIYTSASEASKTDQFRKGMFVDHPIYGRGRILQLEGIAEGRKATVQFPTVGAKRFVLCKAPLEPV